ncbi:ComEC/Rec2 family competence protein [uncultured Psychroserpens sp.]|uniref:ComEC/Rec2 family competence protein n=1 Tax=uncultured Psychroserpens sp. TaxID=255436 RepID=UPI0026055CDE|nr:ComEC/Rec2 family competence protein [uncultured Psychroserpens sp.]
MKPLNSTVIKLTFSLASGILATHLLSITLRQSIYGTLIFLLVFTISFLISKRQYKKTIWFGVSTYCLLCFIGTLTYNFHNQKNFKTHYSHTLLDNDISHQLTLKIREQLKSSLYHDKYIVDLLKKDKRKTCGKLLLYIKNDSTQHKYNVDDLLYTYAQLQPTSVRLNPNQFDYKSYLEKQHIYHQVYANQRSILTLKSERNTVLGYAQDLRQKINAKLKAFNFKPEELAIINALLLGQRQDMSQNIYNDYVNAGAVHILAVSGLHIGIILMILQVVLKPIEYLKYGKFIKVSFLLILLWSFAIIAGLSASVTRAVTMFSIVAIALHSNRLTNIYNTLTISIFILLLCQPMFLFDVGFQMSYLAVFAIVSIQPLLYKLWAPKWKIQDYLWKISTVTIAAQIGVVPISLYYFHQFPSLFFISNLAIIPFLGIILGLGILVIVLALLNSLPEFLAQFFGNLINLMNTLVGWVAQQEAFLVTAISFGVAHILVYYTLTIAIIRLYTRQNYRRWLFLLITIVMVQSVMLWYEYKNSHSKFVVFHKRRHSIIAEKRNATLHVFDNLDSIAIKNDKLITNFSIGHFINTISRDSIKSVYVFKGQILLVIDSLAVYNIKSFRPDIVLLRNSPRLNLERLIDSIEPKLIIADGSNYKSYISRWEATCQKRQLPFHQTGKKGAFIIK